MSKMLTQGTDRARGGGLAAAVAFFAVLGAFAAPAHGQVASNLLQNPGFEGGRTGWNLGVVVASPVHSGVKALEIVPNASSSRTSTQFVPITGGLTYRASGWIKTAGLTGGARLLIHWWNGSGTRIRTDNIGSKITGAADWTWSSASSSAPPAATQARFVLRVEPEADAVGQAWFDDLSFERSDSLPSGFVQSVVTSNLVAPTDLALLPDGRILLAEHRGVVKVFDDGSVSTFLDIRSRVNNFGERGLFGIAVDPAYTATTNNFVYLYYAYESDPTDVDAPKTVRLSRFTVSGGVADPTSEAVLVGKESVGPCGNLPAGADCIPSDARDHHGGGIRFASDGTLFLSTGDGATACCVTNDALRAQDVDSLAGKILHVTRTGAGLATNPFWNGNPAANRSKVWAYGLRNPFRFDLRPGSGRPYLGDVGWNNWEEIDAAEAGSNLGWPCYEGSQRQPGYEPRATCQALYAQGASAATEPILSYAHGSGQAAVTGGVFYNGTSFPEEYRGAYFYADYALGWIRHVRLSASDDVVSGPTDLMTAADGPVDIEVAPDGSLMYLSINTGELRRIRYNPIGPGSNQSPTANADATPTEGLAPLTVQFSSQGSSDPDGGPISHTWNFGNGSAPSSQASPQHLYTANGTYEAVLTVRDDEGQSSTDRVTITVGNRPPTASIDQPASSFRYVVGGTVDLAGSAIDPDEGALSGNDLSWNITIQHCPGGGDCHTHPFLTATGSTVSFQVPDHGDDTHFRVALTATDAGGLSDTVVRNLDPQTVEIRLNTVPTGLQLVYDGESVSAPFSRLTPVNSTHTIQAPSPQGGATFVDWSDGGAQQHDVVVGAANATFTATFATSNLLQNPGFEGGSTGWSGGTIVTSPVHSGTRALRLLARSSSAQTSVQAVSVSGGTAYAASGWLQVANLTAPGRIQVQWRNATGGVVRTDTVGTLTGTAGWTQRSRSITAPATATLARFILRVEKELDGVGTVWFDDLSLRRS